MTITQPKLARASTARDLEHRDLAAIAPGNVLQGLDGTRITVCFTRAKTTMAGTAPET